jgi:acyl-coenzyme A thioesterase PaaI-like protein
MPQIGIERVSSVLRSRLGSEIRFSHPMQETVSNIGDLLKISGQDYAVSPLKLRRLETTKTSFWEEQGYNRIETGGCSFFVSQDIMVRAVEAALLVSSFNQTPFHKLLGLELVVIDRKKIIAAIEKTHQLSGQVRLLHGGAIAACLDGAGAFQALHEIWHRNEDASSFELTGRAQRLANNPVTSRVLICSQERVVSNRGHTTLSNRRRFFVNQMEMIDTTGKLVAKGKADYLEFSRASS